MTRNVIATTNITAEVNMKTIHAGKVEEYRDDFGNPQFWATSSVNGEEFRFWSPGGARLFVELQAKLHA